MNALFLLHDDSGAHPTLCSTCEWTNSESVQVQPTTDDRGANYLKISQILLACLLLKMHRNATQWFQVSFITDFELEFI